MTIPCYLCKNTSFTRRLGSCRDNASIYPEECTLCGLVRLSSFTQIDDDFYADAHMHDSEPCDPALLLRQGQEDTDRRMAQWGDLIAGKHLLDFGCGAGSFLLAARDRCTSVTGVEPEQRLQPFFRDQKLNVYSNLADIPAHAQYDVVTMFHVLEHLPDPLSVLHKIRQVMGNSREREREREREQIPRLIIEVPSASDALLTLYENENFANFTYWSCHLYLHTEATLQALVVKAGFKTVEMRQFQRYPLANHLHWLAKGKPGGQNVWKMFNEPALIEAYNKILAEEKRADTLIGVFEPK